MKYNKTLLLFMGWMLLMACSSDIEDVVLTDNRQVLHTATLYLNGGITNFDEEDGVSTRSTSYEWKDGAKLYIQYTTASGRVDGTATFSQSKGQWEVQYYGTITQGQTAKCEVYFFDQPQFAAMTTVTLSAQTAVFADSQASYLYEDGVVKLTAHLKPLTGRLRFRGTAGQKVSFSGLKYYTDYDITANKLSDQAADITLTVASDGYTPYVYAVFANSAEPQLTVDSSDDDYIFLKTFNSSVLATGKSGFIDIPTTTNRNGWQLKKFEDPLGLCPNGKHPHAIDMGDGLKWSCCNVGAKTPIEYGDYYAWGETTTKSRYNWITYKWCLGTYNTMTKYCCNSFYGTVDNKTTLELTDDAAWVNWGSPWRMPTIEEFSKLNSDCTWTWTTVGGINGYKVTAFNGNILFLPAAGEFHEWSLYDVGTYADYWSSSLHTSGSNNAHVLHFSSSDHDAHLGGLRNDGQSVRPVTE